MTTRSRERSVRMSGPEVRAVLQEIARPGTGKAQTRRIITPQPRGATGALRDVPGSRRWWAAHVREDEWGTTYFPLGSDQQHEWKCPFGKLGDRLWVRETWAVREPWMSWPGDAEAVPKAPLVAPEYWRRRLLFRADEPADPPTRWRPSIHMPCWASRLTLEVTSVRVERLQEITEEDAIAEGLTAVTKDGSLYKYGIPDRDGHRQRRLALE